MIKIFFDLPPPSVVITLYLSSMPSLRHSSQHITAWRNRKLPPPSTFFSCFPLFFTPNSHFPPCEHPRLSKQWAVIICLQEPQSIHLLYIQHPVLPLLSLLAVPCRGRSPGVSRSTQGVIPTAELWSELSLAQQTGGAEAKRLFLPRERGNRREKRQIGASLLPFKLLRKDEFLHSFEGWKGSNFISLTILHLSYIYPVFILCTL